MKDNSLDLIAVRIDCLKHTHYSDYLVLNAAFNILHLISQRRVVYNYPLGDWPRLVRVVSLNKLQPVLSHICDNSPVSVN